jgi:hypothetical protein
MLHRDPYHSPGGDLSDRPEAPRNPAAIAAENEYQRWNALVMAKDTDAVIALHQSLMTPSISTDPLTSNSEG